MDIPLQDVRNAVGAIFGDIFDNLAEIIEHLDCDLVLFAGRPSRLPALVELLVNKLPIYQAKLTQALAEMSAQLITKARSSL